jgi:hypothetical protein
VAAILVWHHWLLTGKFMGNERLLFINFYSGNIYPFPPKLETVRTPSCYVTIGDSLTPQKICARHTNIEVQIWLPLPLLLRDHQPIKCVWYIRLTNQMRTKPVRGSGNGSGTQIWTSIIWPPYTSFIRLIVTSVKREAGYGVELLWEFKFRGEFFL